MAVYVLCCIIQPQYVPEAAAAAFTLVPQGFAATTVPTGQQLQIATMRVTNITANPVTLQMWRVPSGGVNNNTNLVVASVTIPPASQTFPGFDVTAFWGATLQPGDAIWAQAGTLDALVIEADGVLVTN